jgi:bifunctional non-homologous end joining protein LigD
VKSPRKRASASSTIAIPAAGNVRLEVGGREVRLTNLDKPFWTSPTITKGHLIQYYADIAPVLLPHIADRAMVMKRYPHGAAGEFFFMKRAPSPRPDWIRICRIGHDSGNVIDFPVIDDLPSLLWVINLGCIDLNQWYARCDDLDRPDYVHFDLDPGEGATWDNVLDSGLIVREALDALKMPSLVKTTGSRGLHVYVPIVRGPSQKDVWTFAKALASELARRNPKWLTAEYKVAKRPAVACSSTTTRTRRVERWRRSIRSGRVRARRCRRPSRGQKSSSALRSTTSASITSAIASPASAICGSP